MIYLAGSCSSEDRNLMVNIGKTIRNYGFEVYCPFELQIENAWDYTQEDWSKIVFDKDVEAIDKADIVILISVGRKSTAGTNWEQGYAYAKGKRVYVFQITDKPTSLMTFCGCTWFKNTTRNKVGADIGELLSNERYNPIAVHKYFNNKENKNKCKTVLT